MWNGGFQSGEASAKFRIRVCPRRRVCWSKCKLLPAVLKLGRGSTKVGGFLVLEKGGESMRSSRGHWFQRAVALPVRRFFARDASTKLFVGGLSYDTNEAALKDAFCQHGEIIEAKVICDRITGKSKGYGFVQFCKESEATNAMQKTDGQLLDGRNIRVHYANKG